MNQMLFTFIDKLFIQMPTDLTQNNVIAAIITAASEMAEISTIVTAQETTDVLVNLFDVRDNKEVAELLGMPPTFTKALIGYHVDYQNKLIASRAYNLYKSEYDRFYLTIKAKSILDCQKQEFPKIN